MFIEKINAVRYFSKKYSLNPWVAFAIFVAALTAGMFVLGLVFTLVMDNFYKV